MYFVYKEIIINPIDKQYKTILVCDTYPDKLKHHIHIIKLTKRSIYEVNHNNQCLFAFKKYTTNSYHLYDTLFLLEELPLFIILLNKYGYYINNDHTILFHNNMIPNVIMAYE